MANGRRTGRRTDKAWLGFRIAETTIGTTQGDMGNLPLGSAGTLMRTRGELLIVGRSNAITDDDVVGVGLILLGTDAVAVGGASIASPLDDLDAPWIWHQFVPLISGTAGTDPNSIGDNFRVSIDSKSMRKFKPNQSLTLIAELATGNYATVALAAGLRFLIGT